MVTIFENIENKQFVLFLFYFSDENENCSICMEDMTATDSRYLNTCRHRFHNTYIDVS